MASAGACDGDHRIPAEDKHPEAEEVGLDRIAAAGSKLPAEEDSMPLEGVEEDHMDESCLLLKQHSHIPLSQAGDDTALMVGIPSVGEKSSCPEVDEALLDGNT